MVSGWLISVLTFPGTILHEWAHKKFCDWFGVKVLAVKYFSVEADGWVIHEHPKNYLATFWISAGPLIINSLACFLVGIVNGVISNNNAGDGWWFFTLWFALSLGAHSFPSNQDMRNILDASRMRLENGGSPMHYFAYPLFGSIWLVNILRFFWFDFIWAMLIVYISWAVVGVNL